MTISTLPDDALLEIFKFYVDESYNMDAWHTLVHVCRKWRYVVFASPRWLHLELRCTTRRPVKKLLDIWPALPIVIQFGSNIANSPQSHEINLIAALERHDVVCRIELYDVSNSLLNSAAMKKRFPMLTDLTLVSYEKNVPVISDSFLDGSAPRLETLLLSGIPFPFPALRKLLLSATDLVYFRLENIPNSGIISPDLIVTTLSTLTSLQYLHFEFRSPRPRADRERRHSSLSKRLVLPSLTDFDFKGDSEYLEVIIGRIDAPALNIFTIIFFNQLVFDTPQLREFFSRTEGFREPHRAEVLVTRSDIQVKLSRLEWMANHGELLDVTIWSSAAEFQLSSLAQFCSSSLPPLPILEHLSIHGYNYQGLNEGWTDDMEGDQWLELLHPFVAVKHLVLPLRFEDASRLATALRELMGTRQQTCYLHFDESSYILIT